VFDANHNVSSTQTFDTGDGSLANINFGPGGCLYYITIFPGSFHRICYGNFSAPPNAVAASDKTSGNLPLAVAFSSAGSIDPTGGTLSYQWNFGDGATSTAANPT